MHTTDARSIQSTAPTLAAPASRHTLNLHSHCALPSCYKSRPTPLSLYYCYYYYYFFLIIIEDIYIVQVRSGHKCAVSAEMAVWLRNCLCNYVTVNPKKLCMQIKWRKFRNWRTTPTRGQNGGRDHNGFQPPKSKFSGYVAANVQLYKQRNRSSRCLHKVSK